jgi:hypothetical protein
LEVLIVISISGRFEWCLFDSFCSLFFLILKPYWELSEALKIFSMSISKI